MQNEEQELFRLRMARHTAELDAQRSLMYKVYVQRFTFNGTKMFTFGALVLLIYYSVILLWVKTRL